MIIYRFYKLNRTKRHRGRLPTFPASIWQRVMPTHHGLNSVKLEARQCANVTTHEPTCPKQGRDNSKLQLRHTAVCAPSPHHQDYPNAFSSRGPAHTSSAGQPPRQLGITSISAQTTYRQRSSDILNPSSIAARAYDKPPQNSEEPKKKKKEGDKKLETAHHVQNNIKSKLAHRKPRFQAQARHQQPPQTLKYRPPRPSPPNPTNHHLCISKPPAKSTPENKRQPKKPPAIHIASPCRPSTTTTPRAPSAAPASPAAAKPALPAEPCVLPPLSLPFAPARETSLASSQLIHLRC